MALPVDPVERARARVTSALERMGPSALASIVGIGAQSLVDFSTRVVDKPRAANWSKIRDWADSDGSAKPESPASHSPPRKLTTRESASGYSADAGQLPDPVVELVRRGQAEQAAWVLEFAAKLLEAGAQRLRQGIADAAAFGVPMSDEEARARADAIAEAHNAEPATPLAGSVPASSHRAAKGAR